MARGIPAEVVRHFQSIPLFGSLTKGELRSVVKAAGEVDEPAGKTLVREGDPGREMFVLSSGTASVTRGGRKLKDLGAGDFFGELALLTNAPRSATVTATSDVRLFVLSARDVHALLQDNPRMAVGMLSAVATRLRENERSVLS